MNEKVIVLIPEAPAPAVEGTAEKPRRLDAAKLRIGVLDNGKGNADHLLRFVLEGLKAELPVASFVSARKASVSLPAQKDILDRLAAESDFVVTAMAD